MYYYSYENNSFNYRNVTRRLCGPPSASSAASSRSGGSGSRARRPQTWAVDASGSSARGVARGKLRKGVNSVDLGESFQTHTYLQNLASIQPRTSPVKFAASRETGPTPRAKAWRAEVQNPRLFFNKFDNIFENASHISNSLKDSPGFPQNSDEITEIQDTNLRYLVPSTT